jgi:crotonobetainyl-CoA:carnitine CoA-transferase CaiB-like acyl-CoA transferase
MTKPFSDLKVIELAGVLAGPSAGLFFSELGANVVKIENPKTGGDVTRSWKLQFENKEYKTSAYYWSINAGKEVLFLDLTAENDLQQFYDLLKTADVLITNYKLGDDVKLKVDYKTLKELNPNLIYASISGFGNNNPRTAYDLILQAESGFMFMNGEKNSNPLKMPVALIDILAGHQLKEAILVALIHKYKTNKGSHVSVSLFDTAIASLANQATNWLIAHHLPSAQGSFHPNIAPYGEIFKTKDNQQITFAIGSDKQFKQLCEILKIELTAKYQNNQLRITNRQSLFEILNKQIQTVNFDFLFSECLRHNVPIGKIRNLKEVFELPEAQNLINSFEYQNNMIHSVKSVSFKIES